MDAAYKKKNGPYLYFEQCSDRRELLKFEGQQQPKYGRRLTHDEVLALQPVSAELCEDDAWTCQWFAEGSVQSLTRRLFCGQRLD